MSAHLSALLIGVGSACAWGRATVMPTTGSAQTSQEKAGRTTAQAKLDSRLRAAVKQFKAPQADGPPRRTGAVDIDAAGKALVDIQAQVTTALIAAITAMDGLVISQFPQYNSIRARVPVSKLENLAERPDVIFIRTAEQAVTNPRAAGVR